MSYRMQLVDAVTYVAGKTDGQFTKLCELS